MTNLTQPHLVVRADGTNSGSIRPSTNPMGVLVLTTANRDVLFVGRVGRNLSTGVQGRISELMSTRPRTDGYGKYRPAICSAFRRDKKILAFLLPTSNKTHQNAIYSKYRTDWALV